MALEAYLDSNGQLAMPLVASTRGGGGFLETLNSYLSLQKDGLSGAPVASHFDPAFGKLSTPVSRMVHLNANLVSGDMNSAVLNNTSNSGPSIGASSLVTDANSPLSGVAHLQRSGSPNMDSYLNLPSSPVSFSSNNLSPSVLDGSSIAQQTSHLDQNCRQGRKRMQPQQQENSTATCQSTSQTHRVSLPTGINQESGTSTQMRKKPRLDMNKEDILHQQILQQLLQRQDSLQLQDHNQQLQALIQQHRLKSQQQQQILQSIPQAQGVHVLQQQQQMRHHLKQQITNPISAAHPLDVGICSRRLMQYIYHLRHRPLDNNIAYWRKFVADYYAPCAKKRWCLSLYDNIGQHALGVFSQAAMEAWHCDICGSKSGKGFEAIFEILPRLGKIKFESGVIDELLFLDLPHERRFPSGLMMLEYGKAVQESVYQQFRVVREGKLRIIFSHELKILSWEFCARNHEELLPRRLVAPQVNHLVHAADKYQNTINDSGSDGVLRQDLQSNCNMFLTAGRQLARNLELILVNDLGFSKRYVRCLQIAEVVNSMKDLMTFSHDKNMGPIESLKSYPREDTTTNIQMQQMEEIEQVRSAQCLLTDRNKLLAMHPGPSSNMNVNSNMTDGVLSGSELAVLALTNYQKMMQRQNSGNSTMSTVKQEPSCLINCSSQSAIPSPVLVPRSQSPGMLQNLPNNGLSSSQLSQGSKNLQQRIIDKLLQEMVTNSRAKGVQSANGRVKEEVLGELNGSTVRLPTRAHGASMGGNLSGLSNTRGAAAATGDVLDSIVGRTDSSNAASNSNLSKISGNTTLIKREPDLPESFHLPEAVQDMANEFSLYGILNGDWKNMDYGWKA
ncbi:hypothetical protein F0562_012708 [Nyssa sinensis]|uniref:Transcriptional regulator SLK2 n=1 Tax=Nyssa sinensis TaxID=561372 RepID=A0A5J4ZWD3_9ASTE|nr:hypothetical protein F0562_012708 [Nyssa sinensis]